ncbi:MFS transporter [Paenibacillus physcomitrellae]|uniref:MFS transporter n=1 Tax=Paenibacillus physcomitrellae TaxID=1619311 RepID=A0ABQ1FPA4_9BACL|nr:MFS transporter [Paenibacillus physcomitrellae]GGA23517.1 MFS transporter [Paenibacillus physcomitrellae]
MNVRGAESGHQHHRRTLPRSARLLLAVNACNALGTSLSSIFINVYWYKLTQDMSQTLLFNLITYLAWLPAFAAAGWLSKKASRTKALWIGSAVQVLFYISVLGLGTESSKWLTALGILNGIGQGFYWMSVNVLSVDVTSPENRDWFNGINGIAGAVSGMIGPLVAGIVVGAMPQMAGYTTVFMLSFVCFLVSLLTALLLPKDRPEGGFDWRSLLQTLQHKEWRSLTFAFVGIAFRDGVLSVAVWLWLYIATGSESSTGQYAFLTTLLSVGGFYVVGRFAKEHLRWRFMVFGAVLISLSMTGITLLTTWSLVFYAVVSAACRPFFDAPFNTTAFNAIGRFDRNGTIRIELVVWREAALSVGRISSVALLYAIYRSDTPHIELQLNLFLGAMVVMGLMPLYFIRKAAAASQRSKRLPKRHYSIGPSEEESA